jgi:hypothetical protein
MASLATGWFQDGIYASVRAAAAAVVKQGFPPLTDRRPPHRTLRSGFPRQDETLHRQRGCWLARLELLAKASELIIRCILPFDEHREKWTAKSPVLIS